MNDKSLIEEKKEDLIRLTTKFCEKYLDEEYEKLCKKVILKMARKRSVPFLSGRIEIWAGAIIYALGQINFLFDGKLKPYITRDIISDYFCTSKSTISQKAKIIRDIFNMRYWDEKFSTSLIKAQNPFKDIVFVSGIPIKKSFLPFHIQEVLNQLNTTKINLIDDYIKYRKIGKVLLERIIGSCLNREIILNCAKLLGFAKGKEIIFNSDSDNIILNDFALNDYKVNNKSAIDLYRERFSVENEIEEGMLDGLISSYTSLFKIDTILRTEKILILSDILNNKTDIKLLDINLSQSTSPGSLIFIRLVPFKHLNVTSGIIFPFQNYLENDLITQYNRLIREIRSNIDGIKRFVSFFKLYRKIGNKITYRDV